MRMPSATEATSRWLVILSTALFAAWALACLVLLLRFVLAPVAEAVEGFSALLVG